MDFRPKLHTVLSFALIPSVSFLGEVGLPILALWVLFWPAGIMRGPQKWDPPVVLVIAACVFVLVVHSTSAFYSILAIAIGVLAGGIVLRIASTIQPNQVKNLSAGSALTLIGLFFIAVVQSWMSGFGQVQPATFHPNMSAALVFALAAVTAPGLSGYAGRGQSSGLGSILRWLRLAGIISALPTIVLTGSRSGLVGVAAALVAFVVVISCHYLLRGIPKVAVLAPVVVMLALLVTVHTLAVTPTARARQSWSTLYEAPVPGLGTGSPTDDIAARFAELSNLRSASGTRVANWAVARQLVAERPLFGYGFAEALQTFQREARDRVLIPTTHPHNSALLLALQGGGMLLAAAMLLALTYGYRLSWAIRIAGVKSGLSPAILLSILFGLLFADTFDLLIVNWQILLPVGLGIVCALCNETSPRA